jgi:BNR/Asp-box repeat protein
MPLFAGTEDGIWTLGLADETLVRQARGVEGQSIRAIATSPSEPNLVLAGAGLRGWGLFRSEDGGRSFARTGFQDHWVWDVVFDPVDAGTVYVGTEPPMVWISHDEALSFSPCSAVDRLPGRPAWTFFYEPFRAGHVHGFGLHRERPGRLIAGVEVGGLIVTEDGGRSWSEKLTGEDVHKVAVAPDSPDRVFATTGRGLFVSEDGGDNWVLAPPLDGTYLHSIDFDSMDPATIYVSTAREAFALLRSDDGGETWKRLGQTLPSPLEGQSPIAIVPSTPRTLFFGANVGERESQIFRSADAGESWASFLPLIPRIRCLLVTTEDS